MSDRWILNASPLIVMGKIGQLALFTSLAQEVVIPDAVAEEIKAGPENDAARSAIENGMFKIIQSPEPAPELIAWDLGAGETSVIACALNRPNSTAILDDSAARKCASSFGIPIKGSLAIVILAKKRNLIPSATQLIRAIQDVGLRLDESLVRQVLKETVGEDW
ncbi:MAG: DUF3368 domain-containing protein [Anaerolineales bacterium]|nr:DUF3368 domain-containing protein [Anaerolineales bacterium]